MTILYCNLKRCFLTRNLERVQNLLSKLKYITEGTHRPEIDKTLKKEKPYTILKSIEIHSLTIYITLIHSRNKVILNGTYLGNSQFFVPIFQSTIFILHGALLACNSSREMK